MPRKRGKTIPLSSVPEELAQRIAEEAALDDQLVAPWLRDAAAFWAWLPREVRRALRVATIVTISEGHTFYPVDLVRASKAGRE